MKKFKKIISVLLVISILMSAFSISVFAKSDKEYVACMYVCHMSRKAYLSGHTWLYFENLTNHEITVGAYKVPAKGTVSVGTFGYSIRDGRGLYYNVERYRYNHPKLTNFVYVSKKITRSQLDRISGKITRSGYWNFLLNCSFFAFTTWDLTPEKIMIYTMFPLLARFAILIYPSHSTGKQLQKAEIKDAYKQKGFGKNAYLIPADPRV